MNELIEDVSYRFDNRNEESTVAAYTNYLIYFNNQLQPSIETRDSEPIATNDSEVGTS